MLYLLAEYFNFEGLFNLVRYQTARAGATLLTALLIGPKCAYKVYNFFQL